MLGLLCLLQAHLHQMTELEVACTGGGEDADQVEKRTQKNNAGGDVKNEERKSSRETKEGEILSLIPHGNG